MLFQAFTVEVTAPEAAISWTGCAVFLFSTSECNIIDRNGRKIVRLLGSYSESQVVGRVLIGNAMGKINLNAIITLKVVLVDAVLDTLVFQMLETDYTLATGVVKSINNVVLPARRLLQAGLSPARRRMLALVQVSGVWGDTSGDGVFNVMDVLFLQSYLTVSVFSGDQSICAGTCQLQSTLSAWQVLQLKAIRNPNRQGTAPDGSDVLFLLRVLAGKIVFLTKLNTEVHSGGFSIFMSFLDYSGKENPPNMQASVVLTTRLNLNVTFNSDSASYQENHTLLVQCMSSQNDARGGLVISTQSTAFTYTEDSVPFSILINVFDVFGQTSADRTFSFLPFSPVDYITIVKTNTSYVKPVEVLVIPVFKCINLCDDQTLFLDYVVGPVVWVDDSTIQASYALQAPIPEEWYDVLPAYAATWTQRSLSQQVKVPDQANIMVGRAFNITFTTPANAVMGMYIFNGAGLLQAYGGEAYMNAFFASGASAKLSLESLMQSQGSLSLSVAGSDILASNTYKSFSGNILSVQALGVAPELVSVQIKVLCRYAVLWSAVGGVDDQCGVDIRESWNPPESSRNLTFVCVSYPCTLVYGGQKLTVPVLTYNLTNARIVLQKNMVSLGGKFQWRAVCTVTELGREITVNKRALSMGLISIYPPNAAIVNKDSMQAKMFGIVTVGFSNFSVSFNVSQGQDPVIGLKLMLVTGMSMQTTADQATVSVQTDAILAGSTFHLWVFAQTRGGFTVKLDINSEADNVTIQRMTDSVTLSPLDRSCSVRQDAAFFNGTIMLVTYRFFTAAAVTVIYPFIPVSMAVCCSVKATYPGSRLDGLGPYSSNFAFSEIRISFRHHPDARVDPGDPRIAVDYDSRVFSLLPGGKWTVLSSASSGGYVLAFRYTQPGTMVSVNTTFFVLITDTGTMQLAPQADIVLRRIHCVAIFESAFLQASITVGQDIIDVTDQIRMSSSQPLVATVSGNRVMGMGVGTAIITVACRGFTRSKNVTVLDNSTLIVSLAKNSYHLVGYMNDRFPFVVQATLSTGVVVPDISLLCESIVVQGPIMVLDGFMLLEGNTGDRPGSIRVTMGLCGGSSPSVTMDYTSSLVPVEGYIDVQVDGISAGNTALYIRLLGANITSFYMELILDQNVSACTMGGAVGGPFACNLGDWDSVVVIAGARMRGIDHGGVVAVLTLARPASRISGIVEGMQNGIRVHSSIVTGAYGVATFNRVFPAMPLVDSVSLGKQYASLLSGARTGTVSDLETTLMVLVHKQRLMDPRIYSNDFELSAMIRLLDRNLDPDTSNSMVSVLFRTDQLPAIPDGVQTPDGLAVPAAHLRDGWYVVEWRQKMPELNFTVSFTVTTLGNDNDWGRKVTVDYPGVVRTGIAISKCPRGAYDTATILASFVVEGSGTIPDGSDAAQSLACQLQVAARRVDISKDGSGKMSVSVAVESFARLYQINLVIMNDAFLSEWLSQYNFNHSRVDRSQLRYVNLTAEDRLPCPPGYFFNQNGSYQPLPQHSVAGPDCGQWVCMDQYSRKDESCIPVDVSSNLFWTCVFILFVFMLTVSFIIACAQFVLWKTPEEIVEMEMEEVLAPVEDDRDEDEAVIKKLACPSEDVNTIILDEYSQHMLSEMFSSMRSEEDDD